MDDCPRPASMVGAPLAGALGWGGRQTKLATRRVPLWNIIAATTAC